MKQPVLRTRGRLVCRYNIARYRVNLKARQDGNVPLRSSMEKKVTQLPSGGHAKPFDKVAEVPVDGTVQKECGGRGLGPHGEMEKVE